MMVFALGNVRRFHIFADTMMRVVTAGNPHHAPQHGRSYSQPRSDQHYNGHSEAHGFLRSSLFVSM